MSEQPPARSAPRPPRERPSKTTEQALADHATWKPAEWTIEIAGAMQALHRGDADPHQQKMALDWIVEKASGLTDWSYRPGGNDRDTNIGLGRQFVGFQIRKLLLLNLSHLRRGDRNA